MSVQTKVINDILILYFENPKFGNSFGVTEAEDVLKALKSARGKKGLIFHTGGSRVFCSGGNLKDYAKLGTGSSAKSKGHAINKKITTAFDKLWTLDIPTAVVVEGDCFGGGTELVSAFDCIFSTSNAMFGFWQRKIGLSFGWGGAKRLLTRISPANVKRLSLETRNFSAYEAVGLGLVDKVSHSSFIFDHSINWIEQQSRLPKNPLKTLKSVDAKNEHRLFKKLWLNDEHAAILKKFK